MTETPAAVFARLADCRGLLADQLSADAPDPDLCAELHQEIGRLRAQVRAMTRLVYEVDGLATKLADSRLSKSERAKVLRCARKARAAFRAFRVPEQTKRDLARALRDSSIWADDPVTLEAEHMGRVMLALLDDDAATRRAFRAETMTAPVGVPASQWQRGVARGGFRAGVRPYDAVRRLALDDLVTRGVIALSQTEAEEHHSAMVRLTVSGEVDRMRGNRCA